MPVTIRCARPGDGATLSAIDDATWCSTVSPAPAPPPKRAFFGGPLPRPEDVLVAELEGRVVGYVQLTSPTPLAVNRHVLQICGLAVDPACGRRGIGRALIAAARDQAVRRGARRLTLRVLATNGPARALYAAAGFVVEGVLRGEYEIDGEDVDDVLMALDLRLSAAPSAAPRRDG
jgi:ribosomal protein S18 acetylase RimI-like enzyme